MADFCSETGGKGRPSECEEFMHPRGGRNFQKPLRESFCEAVPAPEYVLSQRREDNWLAEDIWVRPGRLFFGGHRAGEVLSLLSWRFLLVACPFCAASN